MHVHFSAPERYIRASHEIVRHPRLRATATAGAWPVSAACCAGQRWGEFGGHEVFEEVRALSARYGIIRAQALTPRESPACVEKLRAAGEAFLGFAAALEL